MCVVVVVVERLEGSLGRMAASCSCCRDWAEALAAQLQQPHPSPYRRVAVLKSCTAGARVPLGRRWRFLEYRRRYPRGLRTCWRDDHALVVSEPVQAPSLVMLDSTVAHDGEYENDGEFNGVPCFKSRHKFKEGHKVLCCDSNGEWVVTDEEDMGRYHYLTSTSKGALLPTGLKYRYWDGEEYKPSYMSVDVGE